MPRKIKEWIREASETVEAPDDLDAEALLWATYDCEKYSKYNRIPRFEAAYAPGGYYYLRAIHVQEAYAEWGHHAARSYSNFQILYIVARELGYVGPPLALDDDENALPWVVKYINTRIFGRGAKTVRDYADAYNSGYHADRFIPEAYIAVFKKRYAIRLKELEKERCQNNTPKAKTESSETSSGSAAA